MAEASNLATKLQQLLLKQVSTGYWQEYLKAIEDIGVLLTPKLLAYDVYQLIRNTPRH